MSTRKSLAHFQRDLFASFVVFLVAIPLCMGIAIASGASPMAGIISGIIGGIIVGSLSGSPLQVSGPAAGLVVIMFGLIERFGWPSTLMIVAFAGALQVVAGIARIGMWFRAVAPAVIYGMLAGIGVSIVASQFHVMLDATPTVATIDNLSSIPLRLWDIVASQSTSQVQAAFLIGGLTLVILWYWKNYAPANLRFLPGPLAGVIVGTMVAQFLRLDIRYLEIHQLTGSFVWPEWNTLAASLTSSHIVAAIGLAIIASAETLLSAIATDRMQKDTHYSTDFDRELIAQGIGNLVAGVIGGLPISGVMVRSTANIEANAFSRKSTILHGTWILIIAAVFPNLLGVVPVSALAAVLVFTGVELVDLKSAKSLRTFGSDQVAIYAATLVTIIFTDLLIGVVTGVTLSAVLLLNKSIPLHINVDDSAEEHAVRISLKGAATFVRLPKLANVMNQVPLNRDVFVDVTSVEMIDHACVEYLNEWERRRVRAGGNVHIHWGSAILESSSLTRGRVGQSDTSRVNRSALISRIA